MQRLVTVGGLGTNHGLATTILGREAGLVTTLLLVDQLDLEGEDEEEFKAIVGSFCPNILFPYARETIATIIQKGGFPEFVLQPINFDALYQQSLQQQQAEAAAATETH